MSTPGLPPPLGQRLLNHVLWPLAATWVVGTVASVGIAQLFAQRAFDRSLLDDAYLLASHVRVEDGRFQLNLTQREVNTVLFDQAETQYFSVLRADGTLVAGHPGLRGTPPEPDNGYRFQHLSYGGRLLRAVTLHREAPSPFDVTVAQTTTARNALLRQLLLDSLLPQAALLAGLAWWLRRSVRADVQPLVQLEAAVRHRGANDLAPVEVAASNREAHAPSGAINALLQRLEQSGRAQREFSGNVAHELRTPLAGIRTLVDFGLARDDPRIWREQLEAIGASEARASALVDRLLAIAVLLEAESRLALQPLALNQLARTMVMRYLPRADAAGVDLGGRGLDAPAWIAGDAALLEGALVNLLDNALRYGRPADGSEPVVTVALERRDGEHLLTVQDNGPGMPDAQPGDLLQRGAQGHAGQLLGEGAGLGLALVAQYTRLLGGRLALRSGPEGRGWVCELAFPAIAPP